MTNGPVIERPLEELFRAAMERGRIALFSAPCGFGKSVVSRALLERRRWQGDPDFRAAMMQAVRTRTANYPERLHLLPGTRL